MSPLCKVMRGGSVLRYAPSMSGYEEGRGAVSLGMPPIRQEMNVGNVFRDVPSLLGNEG